MRAWRTHQRLVIELAPSHAPNQRHIVSVEAFTTMTLRRLGPLERSVAGWNRVRSSSCPIKQDRKMTFADAEQRKRDGERQSSNNFHQHNFAPIPKSSTCNKEPLMTTAIRLFHLFASNALSPSAQLTFRQLARTGAAVAAAAQVCSQAIISFYAPPQPPLRNHTPFGTARARPSAAAA